MAGRLSLLERVKGLVKLTCQMRVVTLCFDQTSVIWNPNQIALTVPLRFYPDECFYRSF